MKEVTIFLGVLLVISFFVFVTQESGKKTEADAVCAYMHATDRGAELVCREKPPWRNKK